MVAHEVTRKTRFFEGDLENMPLICDAGCETNRRFEAAMFIVSGGDILMKRRIVVCCLVLSLGFMCLLFASFPACSNPPSTGHVLAARVALSGIAKGGTLNLGYTHGGGVEVLSLDTHPGERAEETIQRLLSKIEELSWGMDPLTNPAVRGYPYIEGTTTLVVPSGNAHSFSGTETGFGIPAPPTSLSGSYRPETKEHVFEWRIPAEGYDVLEGGEHSGVNISQLTVTAEPLKITFDNDPNYDWARRGFWIMGRRNGVPSNVAAIRVTSNAQEELYGIPFTNGIAPNWTSWTYGKPGPQVKFEEGRRAPFRPLKYAGAPIEVKEPEHKEFYQVIKCEGTSAAGGIYRHFFTLVPKHTYRLYIRVNTLEMGQVKAPEPASRQATWSFSVHAVANKSGEHENLTSEQMAGLSPLSDGTKGQEAGQMLCYSPETTSGSKWVEYNTGEKRPGGIIGDITLPAECDTITVWLRVSGKVASGVGMDWIKLEDLT